MDYLKKIGEIFTEILWEKYGKVLRGIGAVFFLCFYAYINEKQHREIHKNCDMTNHKYCITKK